MQFNKPWADIHVFKMPAAVFPGSRISTLSDGAIVIVPPPLDAPDRDVACPCYVKAFWPNGHTVTLPLNELA
jgi:hypothetical protein